MLNWKAVFTFMEELHALFILFTQLGLNPLGDDGVAALLKAVKVNKSLKVLSLEVWYCYLLLQLCLHT